MATADDAEATVRVREYRQDGASGVGQQTPVEHSTAAPLPDAVVETGSTCYFPFPDVGDTNE